MDPTKTVTRGLPAADHERADRLAKAIVEAIGQFYRPASGVAIISTDELLMAMLRIVAGQLVGTYKTKRELRLACETIGKDLFHCIVDAEDAIRKIEGDFSGFHPDTPGRKQ